MTSADTIRLLLGITLAAVALAALLYLRQREMAWWEYILWGLVALVIPLIGPFVVILSRPGKKRQAAAGYIANHLHVERSKVPPGRAAEKQTK